MKRFWIFLCERLWGKDIVRQIVASGDRSLAIEKLLELRKGQLSPEAYAEYEKWMRGR